MTSSTSTDSNVNSFWKAEAWDKFLGLVRRNDFASMRESIAFSKEQYWTALDVALQAGSEEAAYWLGDQISTINCTTLTNAIIDDDEETLKALIADPKTAEFHINYAGGLQDAVIAGKMWAVTELIPVCDGQAYEDAFFNALAWPQLDMARVFAPLCDFKATFEYFCEQYAIDAYRVDREVAANILAQLEREAIEQGLTAEGHDITDNKPSQPKKM